jgi:hypothetical protein
MFRIVQVKIPEAVLSPFIEEDRPALDRLRGYCDLHSHGGCFVSAPMSTTSAMFFNVEQCLRSMFGDPPHLFEDLTADYRLLRTRAPKAYDYDYCIDIGTVKGEWGEERLVALPKRSVEYQSGRYSSGMFTPITCA